MGVLNRPFYFTLAILLVWRAPTAAQPTPIAAEPLHLTERSVVSIKAPGSNTVGLVWGGGRLWASDQEKNEISYFENGVWVPYLAWDEPGPLAWEEETGPMVEDGNGLWVVDEAAEEIVRLNVSSDPPTRTAIPIPPTALRKHPSITGLAWIGGELWLATGCGLCSTIYRLDANTGEVLQSFFPSCVPRGFAFYHGGLWTVAYSGPRKRPLMSRREVTDDPSDVSSSQDFYIFGSVRGAIPSDPPVDPTAIAIVNGQYWIVDREFDRISRYDPRPMP
jgi:hypothetical protein